MKRNIKNRYSVGESCLYKIIAPNEITAIENDTTKRNAKAEEEENKKDKMNRKKFAKENVKQSADKKFGIKRKKMFIRRGSTY